MKFDLRKNLPVIIIASVCIILFGMWYLTNNVNKKVIITGAVDEPPVKIASESPDLSRDYVDGDAAPVYLESNSSGADVLEVMKDGKINLNTADVELLQTLPGIGEKMAGAIIAYRNENGGFKSIEEIKNVERIGEKTFERLESLIYVD